MPQDVAAPGKSGGPSKKSRLTKNGEAVWQAEPDVDVEDGNDKRYQSFTCT
jgi:hypothetical protein